MNRIRTRLDMTRFEFGISIALIVFLIAVLFSVPYFLENPLPGSVLYNEQHNMPAADVPEINIELPEGLVPVPAPQAPPSLSA